MELGKKRVIEFGDFQLDTAERCLLQYGQPVPLTPKAFDTLLVLVENRGRLIEKDELMQSVWPDTFVEEAGLTRNISSLRKALGEAPGETRYIETIPRRGYRFVAAVKERWLEDEPFARDQSQTAADEIPSEVSRVTDEMPGLKAPSALSLTRTWIVISISAAAILLTFIVIYLLKNNSSPAPASPPKVETMAVLPFRVIGGSSETEHLGISMTDTLITRLSNIKEIKVRPTSSVFRYASTDDDALSVGQALGVDAVLEGSIQPAGDLIRVNVQLITVRDKSPRWGGRFDVDSKGMLAIQDEISERVASALALQLTAEDRTRLAKHYTENAEANELYLKGRYFWNKRTREGYKKAIELFNQAIEKDPSYALAWAGLADCYVLGGDAKSTEEAFSKAKEAAAKAISIDDALAEAHTSLGLTLMAYDWDFTKAEAEFRRAIDLNPNYPTAHHWLADCLILMDRVEEAIASIRRAQELDPLSLIIGRDAGRIFYFAGQYDQAIEQCEKTLEMDPTFYPAHVTLGDIYVQKQAYDEAIKHYQAVIDLSGGRARMEASLAYVYAVSGQKDEARKRLAELMKASGQRPSAPFDLAVVYAGLGEKDQALELLEKAYRDRSYRLIYITVDPVFDLLRSDQRFEQLVRRVTYSPR
ncbi:MAG: tetratricopeptide repeat protein [Acidobacteriota bacterium]